MISLPLQAMSLSCHNDIACNCRRSNVNPSATLACPNDEVSDMNGFFVAFNVVVSMTLLIAIGVLVRGANIIDKESMQKVDKLSFRLFMPTLLFKSIYDSDFSGSDEISGLMLFAFVGLIFVYLLAILIPPRLIEDHNQAASVSQGIIRSNYILFGTNGKEHLGTIALLGSMVVPLTRVLAIIILVSTEQTKKSVAARHKCPKAV
jgi:predicted permease